MGQFKNDINPSPRQQISVRSKHMLTLLLNGPRMSNAGTSGYCHVSRGDMRWRHDGDGNEENGGVRDRGLGGVELWSLGGREGED